MAAVRGIFARENGEGMFFQAHAPEPAAAEPGRDAGAAATPASPPPGAPAPAGPNGNGRKSHLQVVK
jgi:stringent starvation protein B